MTAYGCPEIKKSGARSQKEPAPDLRQSRSIYFSLREIAHLASLIRTLSSPDSMVI